MADCCEKYWILLSAGLDGELSSEEERELEEHLRACPACRALSEELSGIHTAMSGPAAEAPAQLLENVMAAVRAEGASPLPFSREQEKKKSHLKRWKSWGGMAAVIAIVLLGTVAFRLSGNAPTSTAGGAGMPALMAAVPDEEGDRAASRAADPESAAQDAEQKESASGVQEYAGAAGTPGIQTNTASAPADESAACQRLYTELLSASWPDAQRVEQDGTLLYRASGQEKWTLEYLGLSEDGAYHRFLFRVEGDSEKNRWYSVPVDEGAILVAEKAPES